MARIVLKIQEPAVLMTLRTMLAGEGHQIAADEPELLIADMGNEGAARGARCPALLLATAGEVPAAVEAMKAGVRDYILLPLQPGEAPLKVARSLREPAPETAAAPAEETLRPLKEVEMEHILRVLRACKGNQAKAARVLSIGRNTLWRKLKKVKSDAAHDTPPDSLHAPGHPEHG